MQINFGQGFPEKYILREFLHDFAHNGCGKSVIPSVMASLRFMEKAGEVDEEALVSAGTDIENYVKELRVPL